MDYDLSEERLKRARELLLKYAKMGSMAPFDSMQCKCLNCGRVVLVGRCCANPKHRGSVNE